MKRVIVDESVSKRFWEAADAVQVCTPSGDIVGYFTPAAHPRVYGERESPCSEEELRRRLRESGGRPLKDILRDLEAHA
jgi:hypothetical protein